MSRQLTATQVKRDILSLLDDVATGETIEITKHGRTVARLVPASGPEAIKGKLAGIASTAVEDDQIFTTDSPWELD